MNYDKVNVMFPMMRIILLAALFTVQVINSGHALAHFDGDQTNCQICLHAGTGAAPLPGSPPWLAVLIAPVVYSRTIVTGVLSSSLQSFRPSRDSPVLSI